MQISDLKITIWTWECLKSCGINTVEDLRNMTEEEVGKTKGLDKDDLRKLKKALNFQGWDFEKQSEEVERMKQITSHIENKQYDLLQKRSYKGKKKDKPKGESTFSEHLRKAIAEYILRVECGKSD